MTDKSYEDDEARFIEHRKTHPDATRAQFHMEGVVGRVKDGASHHSLGTNLSSGEFWEAGAAKAKRYMQLSAVSPKSRIIDYGCGSLRLGAHFIRYLQPDSFFGLDVTDGFYEIGKSEIGDALLSEKKPRFHVIDEAGIAEASAFGADLVYSNAVCYQVHPDELKTYFDNLMRLAGKNGAQLIFNCMLSDEPVRYSHRSWAWPLSVYTEGLNGLVFVESVVSRDRSKGDHTVRPAVLKFRRGGAVTGLRATFARFMGRRA